MDIESRFYPVCLLVWSNCSCVADFRREPASEVDANQSHRSLRTLSRRNGVHQPWKWDATKSRLGSLPIVVNHPLAISRDLMPHSFLTDHTQEWHSGAVSFLCRVRYECPWDRASSIVYHNPNRWQLQTKLLVGNSSNKYLRYIVAI